jgi:murein DD-endopeptidase MepM/ murein hydrolase activator NlpD
VAVGRRRRTRRAALALGAVLALLAGACGPAEFRHRVRPGENLYRIGKAYGVDYRDLARVNGIDNVDRIEVGRQLVIPNANRELPVEVITPTRAREDRPAATELPADRSPFIWPVDGGIASAFGPRGETHHDGIDIAAPGGTPVRAARGGRVLYSDELRGYGNLLIIDHGEGYATVYAHNRSNAVTSGDLVRQGEVVATVGDSGESSEPSLHFEVRQDNVARNPIFYLPPRRTGVRGATR